MVYMTISALEWPRQLVPTAEMFLEQVINIKVLNNSTITSMVKRSENAGLCEETQRPKGN